MKKIITSSILLSLMMIGGCASPTYQCPLKDGVYCASSTDTYEAALQDRGNRNSGRTSVFEGLKKDREEAKKGVKNETEPQEIGHFQSYRKGAPVFNPSKTYLGWTPSWTDANGILRGGEEYWIATSGRWNYGTLKNNGSIGAAIKPIKPNELGFTPVFEKPNTQKVFDTKTQPVNNVKQNEAEKTAEEVVKNAKTNSDGITQPYQKITD